jgi:hypothetical protein
VFLYGVIVVRNAKGGIGVFEKSLAPKSQQTAISVIDP